MKYYLRLTDSDKFVKGGAYSEEFLNDNLEIENEPHWKEIKDNFAIKLDGTKELHSQAIYLFECIGVDVSTPKFMYPTSFNYLICGCLNVAFLDHEIFDSCDIITLPINQLKQCDNLDVTQEYDPEILVLPPIEMSKKQWDDMNNSPNHTTLGARQPIETRLYEAAKSLNLSYLDGKILESLTNKDYTKIIELCKTQLNN